MKKKLQAAISVLVGVFLLWWVFRGTDWAEAWKYIHEVRLIWLVGFLAAVSLSFVTRIWRWGYIVRTAKPVSFRSLFSATQIGFLANFVLPGRIGEVVRALVLSRLEKMPFTKCFAFVALDRVTDLFGLIAVMLISVLAFHPDKPIVLPAAVPLPEWGKALLEPAAVRGAMLWMGAFLCAVSGSFVLLYANQRLAFRVSDAILGRISKRLAEYVRGLLTHFAEGMHVFRSARDMAKSLAFSLMTWAFFALSLMCVLEAFHLDYPWYTPFVCLSVVSVAIALPNTPGFVGVYHIAVILSLFMVSAVDNYDQAKVIALVAHILNLIPIIVAGVFCLYLEGLRFFDLSRESEHIEEEKNAEES